MRPNSTQQEVTDILTTFAGSIGGMQGSIALSGASERTLPVT